MAKQCENCSGGCKTTVSKVVKILPHPVPGAVGDESDHALPKHCMVCGDTHTGGCHPESFDYFRCSECKKTKWLPGDVMLFFGMDGMQCGCGADAAVTWVSISYEEYVEQGDTDENPKK